MINKPVNIKKKNIVFEIFTNKHVLATIALTLFLIIIFHIGSVLTLPGIYMTNSTSSGNTFTSMLNLLAGGGLSRLSLFSVGIGPYITSQIIMQLLSTDLVPPLARLAKDGERGKKKIEVMTRFVTLPFCVAQAYAVIALILQNSNGEITIFDVSSFGELTAAQIFLLIVIFTAGTYISIFIGDIITKRGVGNGITLLILSGIVASIFSNFSVSFQTIQGKFDTSKVTEQITFILSVVLYFSIFVILILAIIFIDQSIRKIPIQQTGQGLINQIDKLPYLPIKIDSAGVIPVIFASSLMTIPETINQFLEPSNEASWFISNYLLIATPVGLTLYIVFIILFTFFYSYVQLNPEELAENFEKSGKFIPGINAGYDTERYINRVLQRINWIGAPFLAIVAALPYFISFITDIPSGIALGGTGIIIVVSATLELWYSIYSNTRVSGYNYDRSKIEDKISIKKDKIKNNDNTIDEDTKHHLW